MNPCSEVKLSCYGCSQEILTHETNTIKKKQNHRETKQEE